MPTVLDVHSPINPHSDVTNSDGGMRAITGVIEVHVHLGRMVIILVLAIREQMTSSCKKKKLGIFNRKNPVLDDVLHCVLRAIHSQPCLATLLRKETGVGRKSKRAGWRMEKKSGWVVKWPQLT